LYTVVDGDICK